MAEEVQIKVPGIEDKWIIMNGPYPFDQDGFDRLVSAHGLDDETRVPDSLVYGRREARRSGEADDRVVATVQWMLTQAHWWSDTLLRFEEKHGGKIVEFSDGAFEEIQAVTELQIVTRLFELNATSKESALWAIRVLARDLFPQLTTEKGKQAFIQGAKGLERQVSSPDSNPPVGGPDSTPDRVTSGGSGCLLILFAPILALSWWASFVF